jgi:hypothetical protein
MFQMFAAKMFEQRVLAAYREKVALENQRKLLQEVTVSCICVSYDFRLKKLRRLSKNVKKRNNKKQN